ncbi:glycosyltransferase family 4 protein [Methylobacterium sp. DCY52]|jgi:glycosyltransferase involved in cell wall biosynthesis|uniref:glycosyltransferase family 4 protein n=1 Tax=Methylobacterium sp. DCY52 TaxID=739139 RepID=UPI0031455BB6
MREPMYVKIANRMLELFDFEFYQYQRDTVFKDADAALKDYRETGWRLGFRATPFFDEAFYLAQNGDLRGGDEMAPFEHYVMYGASEGRQPHPLFSMKKSQTRIPGRSWTSIKDYLSTPPRRRKSLSWFFSERWYKLQVESVDWTVVDPLEHYVKCGSRIGLSPFPSMDPEYYANSWMSPLERKTMTVLEHFENSPEPRFKTFALFDPEYYKTAHQDIGINACPVSHYAYFGVWEGRPYSDLQSDVFIRESISDISLADRPPIGEYLRRKLGRRKRIIFVGHEGSRTGAPGILLKLVRQTSGFANAECISILDQPGPLVEEHSRVSHTLVPQINRLSVYHHGKSLDSFESGLLRLMEQLEDNPPVAVFCNSAESRLYAAFFSARDIPVITLMHEIATFYPESELKIILENTDLLVFPAEFVRQTMIRKAPVQLGLPLGGDRPTAKMAVIPQGLLRETYGLRPAGDRDVVFTPYGGVSPDDILVTGCGTIDGRKGFDLFVDVVRLVRQRAPDLKIRFAWVGGKRHWRINDGALWDTSGFWAHWDLMAENLMDDIRMISEVADTEPFLVNSDIFLMSSRADPFPCVVHEAMASGLPIVAFENAGGSPEAFLPEAGLVVPYHDTSAMADAVVSLATDPVRRRVMGECGRQIVQKRYRFEDYTRRLISEAARLSKAAMIDFGTMDLPKLSRGRVYFTTPLWTVSGVNTMTEFLVNELNKRGFDAEILITTGRWGPPRKHGGDLFDIKAEYLPNARFRFLQPSSLDPEERRKEVERFLNAHAPCVFVPGFDYDVSDLSESLGSTVGVLGVAHSDDREHYEHARRLGHTWNRIVAVSDEIARKMRIVNPGFDELIEVIRYGLPYPKATTLDRAIDRKMTKATPIKLVYAGRFETFQKRILDYPKLARELSRRGVDYELVMIGEGSQENIVAEAMHEEIAAGRVRLTGRLDNRSTLDELTTAHVVLILSDFEGLPLSLIEGCQRGCVPIVYEMSSGIPEVLDDGVNGFIVQRGDIYRVADHIERLGADDMLRSRMMKASLDMPRDKKLTLDHMADCYTKVIEEILAEISSGDIRRRNLRSFM